MRIELLSLLALGLGLGACGSNSPSFEDIYGIDVDNEMIAARPYGLKVPAGYTGEPTPLVLALHGLGSNGAEHVQLSGLWNASDSRNFLLAFPDGEEVFGLPSWNASCCGVLPLATDDIKYLRAVIADVAFQYNVDPKRIFTQGISNGAFMSHVMACIAADRIAAIAPVAGTMWELEGCFPAAPVAVLHTHGTADTVIPYNGGSLSFGPQSVQFISAEEVTNVWREKNRCTSGPVTSSFDVDKTLSGEDTQVERYEGCEAPVELWTIENGPHVPNPTDPYIETIVDFFYDNPKQ